MLILRMEKEKREGGIFGLLVMKGEQEEKEGGRHVSATTARQRKRREPSPEKELNGEFPV